MRGQGQNVGPLETSQILSVTLTEVGPGAGRDLHLHRPVRK